MKNRVYFILFGLLLFLTGASWVTTNVLWEIGFDINCAGHLKRAADANTVKLARNELRTSVGYLEEHGMTSGYTSIVYNTPDEDVGFWYDNLKSSLDELEKIDEDSTQLEKSNVLMKLRETLLDNGNNGSTYVTVPSGIARFPYNTLFALWFIISVIPTLLGLLFLIHGVKG